MIAEESTFNRDTCLSSNRAFVRLFYEQLKDRAGGEIRNTMRKHAKRGKIVKCISVV